MDPLGTYDPSGPSGGSGKAPLIVAGAVVLVLLLAGVAVFLLTSSGDDGGDDASTEVAAEDQSDAPDDTEVDEPTETTEADASEDTEVDSDEADPDDDGQDNAEDEDDDGDGVPDIEDDDPYDPDVPGDEVDDPDDPDEPGDEDPGDDGDVDEPDEPVPSLDLLRNDPRPAVDGWLDAAGDGAKAVEVVLYPEYGIATIRDGEHPAKVRRLTWRDGSVDEGDLEDPFPGTDLEGESFRLSNVNWDALPGLVADAPARAHLPHGDVTHVIVTSDQPFSARKLFRIYVVSPDGRSAYVVATIDGQPAEP